jgi:hypothetical protein
MLYLEIRYAFVLMYACAEFNTCERVKKNEKQWMHSLSFIHNAKDFAPFHGTLRTPVLRLVISCRVHVFL